MTNPNNSVGTNGAYGGRTSVKAFNDVLSAFKGSGILSGWAATPSSGMTISLGGQAGIRDVAIAEDNSGNRTTINNILEAPISLTLPAAPATNSRIDTVVAYVDNPPEGTATALDNPGACGLIIVSSAVSGNPSAPDDSAIRSAITADGASGSTAYYTRLANITVASGTTTVTANMITPNSSPIFPSSGIDWSTSPQSTSNTASSYVQIGPLLICWGFFQATGIPTSEYGEKDFTVTFPKAFSKTPQLIVGNDDMSGYVGEYALAHAATTTQCQITIGHVKSGSGSECRCGWIAIGAA